MRSFSSNSRDALCGGEGGLTPGVPGRCRQRLCSGRAGRCCLGLRAVNLFSRCYKLQLRTPRSCTASRCSPPRHVCYTWCGKRGRAKRWQQGCPGFKGCCAPAPCAAHPRAPRLPWGEEGDSPTVPILPRGLMLPGDADSPFASPARGSRGARDGQGRSQQEATEPRLCFHSFPHPPFISAMCQPTHWSWHRGKAVGARKQVWCRLFPCWSNEEAIETLGVTIWLLTPFLLQPNHALPRRGLDCLQALGQPTAPPAAGAAPLQRYH